MLQARATQTETWRAAKGGGDVIANISSVTDRPFSETFGAIISKM
jgi:hypothetical protein